MNRLVTLALALVMVLSACGGDDPVLVGIRANSDAAVGDSRLLFAVNEIDGTRRGGPDETVNVVATPLEEPSKKLEAVAEFAWIVEGATGLYLAKIPFDTAGLWQIDFSVSTGEKTEPFLVDVRAEPLTVGIGEQAPMVVTPTVSDRAIDDLTTDPDPMASLYQHSLDELLANGRPTVALFATPAFCTSAACGPLLEQTKALAAQRTDADFIHIEVYQGFNEPGFAPDVDHLVEAVVEFGLPSEPWIFVMDGSGTVIARIEGVLADGELEAILDGAS